LPTSLSFFEKLLARVVVQSVGKSLALHAHSQRLVAAGASEKASGKASGVQEGSRSPGQPLRSNAESEKRVIELDRVAN